MRAQSEVSLKSDDGVTDLCDNGEMRLAYTSLMEVLKKASCAKSQVDN